MQHAELVRGEFPPALRVAAAVLAQRRDVRRAHRVDLRARDPVAASLRLELVPELVLERGPRRRGRAAAVRPALALARPRVVVVMMRDPRRAAAHGGPPRRAVRPRGDETETRREMKKKRGWDRGAALRGTDSEAPCWGDGRRGQRGGTFNEPAARRSHRQVV
eukprot:8594-Pelagococcus_subviridis.AAC.2